ncbi:flagellar hook-length control protein FliK [Neorhodopirellula pilleata]|uniref:Flagellar hook-length control protein FliK n=1 Tax=Neorhodopirellula pilleata TaxID=2714738 RepID=A0A5C6AVD9_9BACT|nr:flagellar hook-length control protein FliK [Neorhodopirellula pilleata]TWU02094.1 Flagellar hook-length control protein FliK [Neorhodopirellula pilleata]
MSVIEAGRNRETTARGIENTSTPIESRLARLKGRLSGSQSLDGTETGGLGDPFAEVFARIATTDAPPPPTTSTTESSAPTTDTDENDREENVSKVDDTQPESENQWANDPTLPALITVDEPKGEPETTEVTTLEANEDHSRELPSGPLETEDKPIVAAQVSRHETEAESQGDPVAPQEQTEDVIVTPQAAQAAAEDIDRRRYETDEVVVGDEQIKTETIEAPVKLEESSRSEANDETSDEQGSRQPNQTPLNHGDDRVERRRYSDDRATSNTSAPQASDSQTSQLGESSSLGSRSTTGSQSQANSGTGSIDVSAMTPSASTTPLSAGVSAAVAAQVTTTVSSSLVGNRSGAVGSATGASATGGTSTGTNATATSDSSNAGLDNSAKNQRGDAASQSNSQGGVTGTNTLSAVQRAKLVQRVSRGFQHLGSNGGQIRMRLSPEALGSVQLQLNIRNGELSGTMITQTDAATEALREQLPQLRRSLESQGIRLEKIDIETESVTNLMDTATSDRQFGDPSGQPRQHPFGEPSVPGQTQRTHWSQVRPTPAAERPAATLPAWSTPTSGVDLHA